MVEVPAQAEGVAPWLDVCTVCQFVWFDGTEYAALPRIVREPAPEDSLPQEAREKLAVMQLDAIREQARDNELGRTEPEEWWQWIPGLLGMPIEEEQEIVRSIPWVTWTMVALITTASLLAFADLKNVIAGLGLVPAQLGRYGGLTFVTSFFLHGGLLHLIGNMYFLTVFGDNVEDWLGKPRYLILLLTAALAGDAVHILGDPRATVPCIGASGGISGIITFYALKFPKAKLGFLVRVAMHFRWICLPAYLMFLIWICLQFYGTWSQLSGFGHVSSLAHLGGVGVGFAFWLMTRDDEVIKLRRPEE